MNHTRDQPPRGKFIEIGDGEVEHPLKKLSAKPVRKVLPNPLDHEGLQGIGDISLADRPGCVLVIVSSIRPRSYTTWLAAPA